MTKKFLRNEHSSVHFTDENKAKMVKKNILKTYSYFKVWCLCVFMHVCICVCGVYV